jgi:methylated-DNA-[protein]-cysteine S-methyltransferase
LDWTEHDAGMQRSLRRQYGAHGFSLHPARNPGGITAALRAYFAGHLAAIDDLPVATGGTAFQKEVWRALRQIPCGETISYGELARRIRRPAAVRAVGLANGANPIAIVVPCHRVIGADGSLTGYGGGLEKKRWLLAHEHARATIELSLTA